MNKRQYAAYLRSPAWAAFKSRYANSDRPMGCFVCTGNSHHFHHLTYARVGNELLDDVVPICRTCHELVHFAHDARYSYQQTIHSISYTIQGMFRDCVKDNTTHNFADIVRDCYNRRRRRPSVTVGPISNLVNSAEEEAE